MSAPHHPNTLYGPDPLPAPQAPFRTKLIAFRHGGRPGNNVFLSLTSFPDHPTGGVHLKVALWACQIAANNTPGYLTTTPLRTATRILEPILTKNVYYYHSEDESDIEWLLCPDFNAWVPPPPERLPEEWKETMHWNGNAPDKSSFSDINDWVKVADNHTCAVTGDQFSLESAHLVPQANEVWFNSNQILDQLCGPSNPRSAYIHDIRNLITLRKDIHALMDAGYFAFVPNGNGVALYFLSHGCPQAAASFHLKTPLRMPERKSLYILYCRFAYTVFYCVTPAKIPTVPRHPSLITPTRTTGLKRRRMDPPPPLSKPSMPSPEMSATSPSSSQVQPVDAQDIRANLEDAYCDGEDIFTADMNTLVEIDHEITEKYGQHYLDAEEGKGRMTQWEYENREMYPGFSRIEQLARRYIEENPQVLGTSANVLDATTPLNTDDKE